MTLGPAPRLTTLVTTSLMSRIAMSGSTATCQAHRTSRSWRRACPAAAGSLTSRRRRWCSSAGRAGAIAFIGSSADVLDAIPPKMVLQFALQDIGQLTDLKPLVPTDLRRERRRCDCEPYLASVNFSWPDILFG